MQVERAAPCKVNLLLNILGKRADGFHELETVLQPVALADHLTVERAGTQIELTCTELCLPTDATNLVYRAAAAFRERARITDGVRIHLDKRIPMAAGLGGGSSDAANTLLALNELFIQPLAPEILNELAANLGSDVPFFLQEGPALGTGRGEKITSLKPFPLLAGKSILLMHPGFGISTPWAYKTLANFPKDLHGIPGRAQQLIDALNGSTWEAARAGFYNSLEAPSLCKYPILKIYQEFFLENGALMSLMSGSGSTTFAIFPDLDRAHAAVKTFRPLFGDTAWIAIVPISS